MLAGGRGAVVADFGCEGGDSGWGRWVFLRIHGRTRRTEMQRDGNGSVPRRYYLQSAAPGYTQ